MQKITIIIPVFNEQKTIQKILNQVNDVKLTGFKKEVVVVNDGSTDKTKELLDISKKKMKSLIIIHKKNGGKGSAVISGMKKASGDYIVIQDADLEYHPKLIPFLLTPIKEGKASVVYGSRLNRLPHLKKEERSLLFLTHYIGNRILSLITSILYFHWITDMETCYKVFPRNAVKNMKLRAKGFEFEPEITAKLLKKKYKIFEVNIRTNPRSYDEGKKLHTVRDGIKALATLIKYRFTD